MATISASAAQLRSGSAARRLLGRLVSTALATVTTVAATLVFTWIDHSEAERRRTLDATSFWRARNARELSLSTLRDAFADLLFPGTGSLHSRARYFFFVAMYQSFEAKGLRSAEMVRKVRQFEVTLINGSDRIGSWHRCGASGRTNKRCRNVFAITCRGCAPTRR